MVTVDIFLKYADITFCPLPDLNSMQSFIAVTWKKSIVEQCEYCCIVVADLIRSFIIGLPLNTSEDEFIEMMSKYGIIMQDPDTSKEKIWCNTLTKRFQSTCHFRVVMMPLSRENKYKKANEMKRFSCAISKQNWTCKLTHFTLKCWMFSNLINILMLIFSSSLPVYLHVFTFN